MKTNYGNWVPAFMMKCAWTILFVLMVVGLLSVFVVESTVLSCVVFLLFAVMLVFTIYMEICRHEFSFNGGKVMGKIHNFVVSKLEWSGRGKLLDIGCGSGALTICCAKEYPEAHITGIDYWGKEWSYGKEQCENNAKIEGIKGIKFMSGDAAKLLLKMNFLMQQ